MSGTSDAREFQARMQRLDELLRSVETFTDPQAQAQTRAILQAVLDLHGAGLERVFEHLVVYGQSAAPALEACVNDDIVAGLLLLHGLHPVSMEERVRQALEQVRPYLHSHGGNVELLGIDDGVARLRLEGSCKGCPSSAVTMKQTIEEAILAKAPDVIGVLVEGSLQTDHSVTDDGRVLVELPVLQMRSSN
jgi:Fe-S cluster biogenesis protein NfuA